MSNLTLSIDDDLLKKARLYAVAHDTSVNAMVREYLRGIAGRATGDAVVVYPGGSPEQRRQAIDGLRAVATKVEREKLIKTDWKWNRDEIYEERFERWNQR